MAVVESLIVEKALEAVRAIQDRGIVRAAFLFGSQIQGSAGPWSDIDVAVFVEGAEDWGIDQHSRACAAAQRRAGLDVEAHIFPGSSFEHPPKASFAEYILESGLKLDLDDLKP